MSTYSVLPYITKVNQYNVIYKIIKRTYVVHSKVNTGTASRRRITGQVQVVCNILVPKELPNTSLYRYMATTFLLYI